MEVAERVDAHRGQLTPTERKLAQAVLDAPERVAFGTVAELAAAAATSGASVVRFAHTLGFDGFSALQESIQRDLGRRLRPATVRIRTPADPHLLDESVARQAHNVERTLATIDRQHFRRAVDLLAAPDRPLAVIVGEASAGIGAQVTHELGMLRPAVTQIAGSEVQVQREVAVLEHRAVVLTLDVGRYDRWLLAALESARGRRASVVGLSDAPFSPIARLASIHFVVEADGVGPFDSYVGALALLDTMVAAVAVHLRASATKRLDRIEAAWEGADALVDE